MAPVPKKTTKEFCTACWGDQSIYGWSASESGFLASYYTRRVRGETSPQRIFDQTISASEFGGGSSFWGSHGRAYTYDPKYGLDIFDYDSKAVAKAKRANDSSFGIAPVVHKSPIQRRSNNRVTIQVLGSRGKPVAVATAPFGTVLQFGDRLLVLRSDGEINTIVGDIVSWRVFPRSINYANQLHVIFEDRLEIYAFLHDYFVDQGTKDFGYAV